MELSNTSPLTLMALVNHVNPPFGDRLSENSNNAHERTVSDRFGFSSARRISGMP
ncbi:hypothetical protein [Spongiactinospora rosea]|uniref:hypothetical protein n=1 Tax=Spongiactinospora rosea TaxID=2248750 RepID=UPI0013142EAA|nr:hypothetical protein [Spongiactinospora rosea]